MYAGARVAVDEVAEASVAIMGISEVFAVK